MFSRPLRVVPVEAAPVAFDAIRREAGVPEGFPADVEREAEEAAVRAPEGERVELPALGEAVSVKLERADPAARAVTFSVAA